MRLFPLRACQHGKSVLPHSLLHMRGWILSASDGIWNMLFSTYSHTSYRVRFNGCLMLFSTDFHTLKRVRSNGCLSLVVAQASTICLNCLHRSPNCSLSLSIMCAAVSEEAASDIPRGRAAAHHVLGSCAILERRSARRAGPNAAGVLVNFSKHTFYTRFHFSLCQRNYEQVRLVHLIVIAVPVPQIQEHIVDVIKVIPEEWMSKQIVQQIVDVPASKILVEIVDPVAYRREATAPVEVQFPAPQIQEKIVEVIRVILQEQCQRMRFFTFERRVVQQLLTGVFLGVVVRL